MVYYFLTLEKENNEDISPLEIAESLKRTKLMMLNQLDEFSNIGSQLEIDYEKISVNTWFRLEFS